MADKISELKAIVAVLKSLPEDICRDVETDPDKLVAYRLLVQELQQAVFSTMFAFSKVKMALDIKYNSGAATYQDLKEMRNSEVDLGKFDELTSILQDQPLEEIIKLF